MKNLENDFIKIRENHMDWSDYSCIAYAVKNNKHSEKIITKWFNKLVSKDDYSRSSKEILIKHLYNLSNPKK